MTNPNTNPNQERLAKKDIGGITAGLLQLENVTLKLIHNLSIVEDWTLLCKHWHWSVLKFLPLSSMLEYFEQNF